MKYIIIIKIRYNCINSVIKLLHKIGFEKISIFDLKGGML